MDHLDMTRTSQIKSFRQLVGWQVAMDLAVDIHKAVRLLPQTERFELGRELRRSATSVPSNVAEGFNRHSRAAYRSHVGIALGSTGELDTQIELATRLEYFDVPLSTSLLNTTDRVGRLLQALWHSLDD
jgi:four helix bundle protein